jgi:hypothetical protein
LFILLCPLLRILPYKKEGERGDLTKVQRMNQNEILSAEALMEIQLKCESIFSSKPVITI